MEDFKELYEKEKARCNEYISKVAKLEEENAMLQFRLDRIHNNPIWKSTKGIRDLMLKSAKLRKRIKNLGGFRGFLSKVNYKLREHKAKKGYGLKSFPSEAKRKEEENTKFDYEPLISILVPLYNTPESFLKEMANSVLWQTYKNWELCLADGSDSEHSHVEKYCVALAQKDSRVRYKKLLKNQGISGNTNSCLEMATGEYIGLFDHDDILHPEVLFEYVKAINEKKADYLYCDETTFHGNSIDKMITMHFKPDYAPDNLRANNYI